MTLAVYCQKSLIAQEAGKFQVDKLTFYRVPRWRILQGLFTGIIKGEWPPKGKSGCANGD